MKECVCPTCGNPMRRPDFRLLGCLAEDEELRWSVRGDDEPVDQPPFVLVWYTRRGDSCGQTLSKSSGAVASVAAEARAFITHPGDPFVLMERLGSASIRDAAVEVAAEIGATDGVYGFVWPKFTDPDAVIQKITRRANELAMKAIEAEQSAMDLAATVAAAPDHVPDRPRVSRPLPV